MRIVLKIRLFLVVVLLILPAASFAEKFKVGYKAFQLGSSSSKEELIGKAHKDKVVCAISGVHITSSHDSDRGIQSGHVRAMSYIVQPNDKGYWVFRHIGGRPTDKVYVICFSIAIET